MPPELRLVANCCRWPRTDRDDATIHSMMGEDLDWSRVYAIVRRNRVGPLVYHALDRASVEIPHEPRIRLFRSAQEAAKRSLILARESLRLQQIMEAEGLPALIVKGIPLAILGYGEIGMKESSDIDLLVSPEAAQKARRLLIEQGYEISLDKLTSRQFERHVQQTTEAGFFNARIGVKVDLHWGLVANAKLLQGVSADGPAQHVAIPGGSLRTLSNDALFAYLCLHGALHNWSRLKWLADLGAFLSRRTEKEVVSLYEAANAYRVGRSATVALLLCRSLLGLSLDERLLRSIQKDGVAGRLATSAVAGLGYRDGTAEHGPYTRPWLRGTIAQFFIVPNAGHVVDQIKLIWCSPYDRTRLPLPRGFEFGYHLLRIPLWLGRIGRRAFERIAA